MLALMRSTDARIFSASELLTAGPSSGGESKQMRPVSTVAERSGAKPFDPLTRSADLAHIAAAAFGASLATLPSLCSANATAPSAVVPTAVSFGRPARNVL